ncbi:MAG: right-handed parallel beta-helix repeat-containing protein [Deltaproteobacteria bacterium]|nr:right-handed parallel beta-helix repeat-containing protein [Deltaproteobacteria bacterium]
MRIDRATRCMTLATLVAAWGAGCSDSGGGEDAGADESLRDTDGGADADADAREDGTAPDIVVPDDGGGEADGTGPRTCDELVLYPTIHAMGLHINAPPAGTTGTAVRYREIAAGAWTEGHPLAAVTGGRLKGSLLWLAPATEYEVEVDARDAGGAVLATYACSAATDPLRPPTAVERTLHVQAGAAAGGDGSETAPFAAIQDGVNAAGPGDQVLVHPGIYRETVEFPRSGEPGRFIQVLGQDGAIVDGSDAEIERVGFPWVTDAADPLVSSAPFTGTPGYLARDGRRFYRYNDLAGLRAGLGDDDVPIDEGWVVQGGTIWTRSLDCPCGHVYHVPVHEEAFYLSQVEYVWVEGFEIRYFGSGDYGKAFYLRDASHCVIRRNHIHGLPSGVIVLAREGTVADRNLIEENWIADPPVAEWPWDAVKGTSHENSAINIGGGAGNLVRYNRIENVFNGVYTGDWDAQLDETLAFETDVYENVMRTIGDDGLEPEGANVNVRFWRNACDYVHSGLSLAPITVGPVWIVRNRFTHYTGTGFKVSLDSSGPCFLYHNTCWTDIADQNGMDVSGPYTNMVFRNNIIRGTRYAYEDSSYTIVGVDMDHDDWYTTRTDGGPHFKWNNVRYDTMAEWCAATGLECHGTEADPGLIDPPALLFGLGGGSANIDAAVPLPGINAAFAGAAPDRGYLELGEGEPSW